MVSIRILQVFMALALIGVPGAQADRPEYESREPRDFLRKVNMREVEVDLQASLSDVLGSASPSSAQRLAAIETSTWQTFQALPKNAAGRLAPAAVRYIVHGYFAKEHGWQIKGLEPHGMQSNVTQVHDISILQDKIPLLVERLLEVRQEDRGLSLSDVIAMVAVLEQLMFDESVKLLEAAYSLLDLPTDKELDQDTLHKVLQSYVILFDQGSLADLSNAEVHRALLELRGREVAQFEQDIVLNFEYERRHRMNPFKPRTYSFEAVAELVELLAQQYGKWQNAECKGMKAHLVELDSEGLGRVPLGLIYAQPADAAYQFTESADYLRTIGALDESMSKEGPQVIIPNYVAGPSNCIASSSYYSVCCLSECDSIFNELEHQVLAPTTSPEKLLSVIHRISDVELPQGLPEKLDKIAAHHGGQVPLHGRLFAQWLHFAFPHECPYPSVVETATVLTPSQWLGESFTASKEEREQHLASPLSSTLSNFNLDEQWSEYEVLPVVEPSSSWFTGSGMIRTLAQLLAMSIVLRTAWAALKSATCAMNGPDEKKTDSMSCWQV